MRVGMPDPIPPGNPALTQAPATGVNAPIVRRIVGGIFLVIGAMLFSACFAMMDWLAADRTNDSERNGEWAPLVMPFFAIMAFAFSCGGYRVLTYPPLHRRRTVLVWFVMLIIAFVLRNAFP